MLEPRHSRCKHDKQRPTWPYETIRQPSVAPRCDAGRVNRLGDTLSSGRMAVSSRQLIARVRSWWGVAAFVVLVAVVGAVLAALSGVGEERATLVVDESSDGCSAMAIYDPNLDLSTNSATTSDIHDSPMTVVEHEGRLAQEDVEVWAGEAVSAASTSERQQAEARRVQAQATVDFFDAVVAGHVQRTDEPGKVTFSTASPATWFEVIEDAGYWYASGLSLSGLPREACA